MKSNNVKRTNCIQVTEENILGDINKRVYSIISQSTQHLNIIDDIILDLMEYVEEDLLNNATIVINIERNTYGMAVISRIQSHYETLLPYISSSVKFKEINGKKRAIKLYGIDPVRKNNISC